MAKHAKPMIFSRENRKLARLGYRPANDLKIQILPPAFYIRVSESGFETDNQSGIFASPGNGYDERIEMLGHVN